MQCCKGKGNGNRVSFYDFPLFQSSPHGYLLPSNFSVTRGTTRMLPYTGGEPYFILFPRATYDGALGSTVLMSFDYFKLRAPLNVFIYC